MIEAVAAFIAELMLEGSGEVSENRRVPRIVRWVAVIARVVAIGLLGVFLLVGAFALGKQSRPAFWSFLGVALLMIGFAIYDIWRFVRLCRRELAAGREARLS